MCPGFSLKLWRIIYETLPFFGNFLFDSSELLLKLIHFLLFLLLMCHLSWNSQWNAFVLQKNVISVAHVSFLVFYSNYYVQRISSLGRFYNEQSGHQIHLYNNYPYPLFFWKIKLRTLNRLEAKDGETNKKEKDGETNVQIMLQEC